MNTKRTNSVLPLDHNIVITKGWLLGYIEGDGSFFVSRTDIEPTLSISATAEQWPLFEKIKEFLQIDLAFDKYSKFKLKHSKAIALNSIDARVRGSFLCEEENQFVETRNPSKAKPKPKPSIILVIKNIKVLNNYIIPYLKDVKFRTKKGLDFLDFTDICKAVYKGSHRSEEIRSLILKLSYNMNNFRLSTFKK